MHLRVLLLADTHLGLDRHVDGEGAYRNDGESFFASFERALGAATETARQAKLLNEPTATSAEGRVRQAFAGQVDLVVHGGDVFFRSRVKPGLVLRAFAPLKRIADAGVPVVVVPGNHERSAIPYPILAAHPSIHIMSHARTVSLRIRGMDVAIVGFPCERDRIAERFGSLLDASGWKNVPAAIRLLCFHQTVEGATVGPSDYVFRRAPDVIPGRAIPRGFAAVLAGHIHRHQRLTADLSGRPLGAPVFYPGSTQRTSRAERGEAKGFVTLTIEPDDRSGGRVQSWRFHELHAAKDALVDRSHAAGMSAGAPRWHESAAR